jgi:acyl-[acyl-carrier-protein]-phospholipid O-acyltransferase/long-chain-fatty-acid--[acyl-carrier-protein] ligase
MKFFFTKRFFPLFCTQFLGAFNDNMLKNALVILLTYKIAAQTGASVQVLVTIAGSLLIFPSLLFSATAGELADKFDKARLTRIIKLVEIGIMGIATAGFLFNQVPALFLALFCMGVHSTFFGPIKLSLLPVHLREGELLAGNSFIEAGTFLAILLGTLAGGQLVVLPMGSAVMCVALLIVAVTGYVTSRGIPAAPAADPGLRVHANILGETWRLVAYARGNKNIFLCILGTSWFWAVGSVFVGQVAPFAKFFLHGNAAVVTLLLTMFSIGVGIGSLLANLLLRGRIQMTYVPLAALGMSLFGVDLFFAVRGAAAPVALLGVPAFLHTVLAWRVMFDFLMLAVAGGLYIVPLYANIQHESAASHLARVIAASNVMNALFMVAAALVTVVLLKLDFTIPQIFLTVSVLNLGVAVYICKLLPEALVRSVLRAVLVLLFRVEVRGMEHYDSAGKRVLIIANHTSLLDAALIAAFLPEKLHFAVNTFYARKWWMKLALAVVHALPVDPTNPLAMKALIDLLKQDQKCMVFPEGRLTVTGALMKIYEGPGMIADKAGAALLPVRIDGAQFSVLSRLRGKVRIRWFPKITLTILPAQKFDFSDAVKGRARRQMASARLYDVMSEMMFRSTDVEKTLFGALLDAARVHGMRQIIAEDVERKPLNYGQFLVRSFVLGRVLGRTTAGAEVGIMLPNTVVTALTFFALQATGRVPAMLNFSAGAAAIVQACGIAKLRSVITSQRFIRTAKLEPVVAALAEAGVAVLYLEDVAKQVDLADKLFGLAARRFPKLAYQKTAPESAAVILYTSGSEGSPKGVVLSHKNILANCAQLASRIDFGPQDKVLNVLPMFHSFGLTGGTLLPILSGIKTFYYPSPLHYRIVPELIYDTNSTIMFGTDTFLAAYARYANPYDMNSIRYIFAGAEKLRDETRRIYADRFGVRIFEGYGATEMSPVISINTPMQKRAGSVGRLLPGLDVRLDEVPGIAEGAVLNLRGPNVMLGYLKADQPGVLQPPEGGWYNTGDIVAIDAQGYVFIKGRQKRFAKIGGEMVSLPAVEAAIIALWPEHRHAVVSVKDERKGEQIVLLTDYTGAARDDIVQRFREQKLPEIALPRRIVVGAVPVLGTGKTDYVRAQGMVLV